MRFFDVEEELLEYGARAHSPGSESVRPSSSRSVYAHPNGKKIWAYSTTGQNGIPTGTYLFLYFVRMETPNMRPLFFLMDGWRFAQYVFERGWELWLLPDPNDLSVLDLFSETAMLAFLRTYSGPRR